MKLIKPRQISGEIMTLFEEADEYIIVISPYYKLAKWYKLKNCLEEVKKRNIQAEFYVRKGDVESIQELKNIDFKPIEIKNLHTKLYINEKYAIVSSMNLLHSSDTNAIDIALKSETKEEFEELYNYYKRYIKSDFVLSDKSENKQESDTDKNDHISQEQLLVLKAEINQRFQDLGIGISEGYMYLSKALKSFGVFIHANKVTLKYLYSKPATHVLDIGLSIEKQLHEFVVVHHSPTQEYSYHLWDILAKKGGIDYMNLIGLITKIQFKV